MLKPGGTAPSTGGRALAFRWCFWFGGGDFFQCCRYPISYALLKGYLTQYKNKQFVHVIVPIHVRCGQWIVRALSDFTLGFEASLLDGANYPIVWLFLSGQGALDTVFDHCFGHGLVRVEVLHMVYLGFTPVPLPRQNLVYAS
jgi:hypothetical protein